MHAHETASGAARFADRDRNGDTRVSDENLKEGSRIKFVGLTKLEHFNESYGTVVRFDSELNRWLCRADLDSKLK